jgi:hypothetical protein
MRAENHFLKREGLFFARSALTAIAGMEPMK